MKIHARCAAIVLGLTMAGTAAAEPAWPPAEQILTVRPGDTLAEMLSKAGVPAAEAHAAGLALSPIFPPRLLAPGHDIGLRLDRAAGNAIRELEVSPAPGRSILLRRAATGFTVEQVEADRHRHLARVETGTGDGVFPSLVQAGLPPALAQSVVRALAHEVDFQRDMQRGDRIEVAFERFRDAEGDLLGHGRVLHATLTLSGREISIWRFTPPSGGSGWYHAEGQPFGGGLLRTPLDGARLTSGFGMRRHPVLGFTRQHAGVDFAAPTGTPVVAAADGVVSSMRVEGGYGRIVRLRHAGGMETRYAHLVRFASGLTPGVRVRQGDVIGMVGRSGVATGPHLHYEVRVKGRRVDPQRYAF